MSELDQLLNRLLSGWIHLTCPQCKCRFAVKKWRGMCWDCEKEIYETAGGG